MSCTFILLKFRLWEIIKKSLKASQTSYFAWIMTQINKSTFVTSRLLFLNPAPLCFKRCHFCLSHCWHSDPTYNPLLLIFLFNLPLLPPNLHPLPSHYSCHPPSTLVVNNSNVLGQPEELALLANETSVTLPNLKYGTRYKFYLNAKTVMGAGPAITEEAVTLVDEGKSTNVH